MSTQSTDLESKVKPSFPAVFSALPIQDHSYLIWIYKASSRPLYGTVQFGIVLCGHLIAVSASGDQKPAGRQGP
jgi:hypothetical protein